MSYFIGIDLGTSSVKLLLMDEKGTIVNSVSEEYPLSFPKQGWSEQNPEDWWEAVADCFPKLLSGFDGNEVKAIGCAGQMHGLVILDEKDEVIRPAILWNDGRTWAETEYLNEVIGRKKLSELTGNIAFAGFTAPKLLWMRANESENFGRIARIMLPKDYVNYMLTGVHSCDYSDASGMLLLDVEHKCYSDEMLEICSISKTQLPKLYESWQCIGTVLPEVAERLGISSKVKVVAGAGDNAAAAIGTGIVGDGGCNISLGTSGTVFVSSDHFTVDSSNGLHSFAHADGGYHLMGCMLSAASCNKWFYENILKTEDYEGVQAEIFPERLGDNGVYFLPYLMGERSPINDTAARGTFIGMTMDTARSDMVQAVLEGVGFALRDSIEVAKEQGIEITASRLCGGGARSSLWRQILANILNIPLTIPETEQGPGMGAAMLAMVASGEYESVADCAAALVKISDTVTPDAALAEKYEKRYQEFKKIYPACRRLFTELAKETSYEKSIVN